MRIYTTIYPFIFLVACSGPAARPTPTGPAPVPAEVKAALKIPPVEGSAAALERLRQDGGKGHCESAWLRIQYLVDLMDAARVQASGSEEQASESKLTSAHALLWKALSLPGDPGRGRLATRQAMDAMNREVKAATRDCADLKGDNLADAAALLAADGAPRQQVKDALDAAVAYKKIARSGSPLAPNARLRLVDWCLAAFRLATGGIAALQHGRINQCLLPLFDADPSAYFDPNPSKRPPDAPWPVIREALQKELAPLAKTRLAAIHKAQSAAAKALFSSGAAILPTPLDLSRFAAPVSAEGAPWDRTPLVLATAQGFYVGGRAVLADDSEALQKAIAARLTGDRRARITLVTTPATPAAVVSYVGRAARLAGARTLGLGVMTRVALKAPPGDVQSAVFGKRPVFRLHEIPLSLRLLSARASRPLARDRPRGMDYDPDAARNSLALSMGRGTFTLYSKHGTLPPVRYKELLASMRELHKAYPDDSSLVLVPGSGATYEELVAVAGMARRDQGQPLFPGLALAPRGYAQASEGDLAPLLRLLSSASVTVKPPLTRAFPLVLRRCYLDTLRALKAKQKPPRGILKLRERKGKLLVSGGTMRHRGLRQCIKRDILATQSAATGARITVTFDLN